MEAILDQLETAGVVPVVVIEDPADAPALVGALKEGGLPVAEITLRTEAAMEAIRAASNAHPDVLIGAGSVLLPDQVYPVADAGARFVVSPGIDEDVVERTRARGILSLPGCATASDVMRARKLGLDTVKYFPAELSGGLAMIKAIAAPFPGLRFVPTGGVSTGNLEDYLRDPLILAVGGSWMVKPHVARARDWGSITKMTREAVAIVRRTRGGNA